MSLSSTPSRTPICLRSMSRWRWEIWDTVTSNTSSTRSRSYRSENQAVVCMEAVNMKKSVLGLLYIPGLTSTMPLLALLCPLLSVTVRVKLYLPSTRLPRNKTAWWSELFKTSWWRTKVHVETSHAALQMFDARFPGVWMAGGHMRTHPGSRAGIISGPQVADPAFVIRGARSIQNSGLHRQSDGWAGHNVGYRRLVPFWRRILSIHHKLLSGERLLGCYSRKREFNCALHEHNK